MKNLFLFGLLFFLTFQELSAQKEHISFNLKFSFMKGGEAEITVYDTLFNDRPAKHFHVLAKTTGLAEKLYGVYDIYETTVDADTYLPLKAIRNVKEGNYRRYNETLFFHDNDSIYSQKSGGRKVPENLLDLISVMFYFIHNQPFESLAPGDAVTYPTINADKISNMNLKFLREEVVETEIGPVNCLVVSPTMEKGKVLKQANGIRFYISKENKLPVFITFDMRVGALKAVIKSYTVDGAEQLFR